MNKYKALLTDIDGTLFPKKIDGYPSPRVTDAIKQAKKYVHIGVATSRPYFAVEYLIDYLSLNGPSVIAGGSQIVDTEHKKIVWERFLDNDSVVAACKIIKKYVSSFFILDDGLDVEYSSAYIPKKPYQIWVPKLEENIVTILRKKLSINSTIVVHTIPSWDQGKTDIVVNHAEATKQHGVFEVAKILEIRTSEIIGIGDGYNDFPLLMACGLKIAMKNAPQDIKAIADYIAPSVEDDGLAHVIEEFVLNRSSDTPR